jgi:D-alanyl-D-alanine carboxypeptidase/D-alanyl-D-alanine-endopeptidase (penicillin-binding protein 4)
MAAEMRKAGPSAGALVVDLPTGRELFAARPDAPRAPASVEKLYTTAAALARFGPDTRLRTTVAGLGSPDDRGTWHGDLFLKGGGDPTFGSRAAPDAQSTATNLAAALFAATGISRVDGGVIGDASVFDDLPGDPATNFLPDPDLGGRLSGLAFDRGRIGGLTSPAAFAASQLAAAIRAAGVKVTGRSVPGVTPPGARVLAGVASPPLATLVAMTDLPSDNFFAETLLKDLGARFGTAGSTPAGAAVVRAWLAGLGITPQIVDGSGLSRADQTTPRQVVGLLRALRPTGPLAAVGASLLAALPVAGRTGTLVHRMRRTPAAGRCLAKTGTLVGVSALAGVCDGRFAFAFLMNAITDAKAHALQDRMTTTLAAAG